MNKVATLPEEQRNELFSLTAEKRGMGSTAIVEKDFWVCWTLKQLFEHPELSKLLIFKGGTSLSKVYGLINRFSEDIDLVLDWNQVSEGENPMADRSGNQQGKLNKTLNEKAITYIAETLMPWLSEALGSHCELAINAEEVDQGHVVRVKYPKSSDSAGILPYIQLEIGPLASWLPHSEHIVTPYAAEDFPQLFNDPKCPVRAIDAERTFWEKATILHHEANRPSTSIVPTRYSRHYYDLHMMAQDVAIRTSSLAKPELLANVVEFKKKFYPRGWAKYDEAIAGTLKLVPPPHVLSEMMKDYQSMKEMMFGAIPTFEEIIQSLTTLETEINVPKGANDEF